MHHPCIICQHFFYWSKQRFNDKIIVSLSSKKCVSRDNFNDNASFPSIIFDNSTKKINALDDNCKKNTFFILYLEICLAETITKQSPKVQKLSKYCLVIADFDFETRQKQRFFLIETSRQDKRDVSFSSNRNFRDGSETLIKKSFFMFPFLNSVF